jgi:putative endonuclease
VRIESERHRIAENLPLTKHVVAAGRLAWDAGSTPAASSLRSERSEERRLPRRSPSSGVGGPQRARTRAPNYDSASQPIEMEFSYVYILQSEADRERHYTGVTDDLKDRLRRHNAGEVSHTSKFRPWAIKTALAFTDRQRAAGFEKYLKTASGRAFAKKRL